ncbi:hypothetical protein QW060_26365 [Myroides ceti]|uniref:Uncharacterized protein n=1 Tax=Paenimyroides ceti TaxID=395087 RepID=A0ABT8D511_9FLAO|nr:hypothetical protein [Paenimyroides ceti]MDN3706529.1 hypothetical protein [Paenimyroides ceti]MDN3710319.1 hypothetical protein [Paenimyroides ceti]MDN3710355.1 hypothetical protein [Paenimyroides ceti]
MNFSVLTPEIGIELKYSVFKSIVISLDVLVKMYRVSLFKYVAFSVSFFSKSDTFSLNVIFLFPLSQTTVSIASL